MAARRVEMFLLSRSVHDLYTLTKEELCSVAERFQVELKSKKKEEMQAELKNALVERSWFENDGGESEDNDGESVEEGAGVSEINLDSLGGTDGLSSSEKFELMKLQMQLQMQREQKQQEMELKRELQIEQMQKGVELQQIQMQKEIEIEKIRAESKNKVNETRAGNGAQGNGDLEKRAISMPNFVEGEEENFFFQFEKAAKMMGWDENDWAIIVQSKFEGRARAVYVNLSEQEARDYEVVKEAVLGSTLLCPDVYRERFRRTTKRPGDTYLGMAREVILKLDRWLKAEEATTLEEVKGVIQMEQFMSQMPLSVRCELASHDVKDVMEAGRRADKYIRT
ncbi:uncharacterized protein LOC135108203 [Scylla paramamosain]|uniref:uncharacterized protein LOC135108203 n=1 Tax=Scylla paramamosain TaxID=85552 RepID=UPI0030831708